MLILSVQAERISELEFTQKIRVYVDSIRMANELVALEYDSSLACIMQGPSNSISYRNDDPSQKQIHKISVNRAESYTYFNDPAAAVFCGDSITLVDTVAYRKMEISTRINMVKSNESIDTVVSVDTSYVKIRNVESMTIYLDPNSSRGWMGSEKSYGNIIDPEMTHSYIKVVIKEEKYFVVQVFVKYL